MKFIATIDGIVVAGEQYGRKLGFPTANVQPDSAVKAMQGIYAGIGTVDGQRFKAGIVVGPLLPSGEPKVEAHLLAFTGDLYDKRLSLELVAYLRKWKTFDAEETLREQIKKDVAEVETLVPNEMVRA